MVDAVDEGSNLAWLDAMASCPGVFEQNQKNWPHHMTPKQVAAIQRPSPRNDSDGLRRRRALAGAIESAVAAGVIPAQEVVFCRLEETEASQRAQDAWSKYRRTGRAPFDYDFRACGPGGPQRMFNEVQLTRKEIGADDFVAWLQSQGEEPSVHVVAWQKATGVVTVSPSEVFPLADWSALVAYRTANIKGGRAPSWALGNQIDIGRAELKRRQEAGATESDALNAMGMQLGLKATAGRTVLKRALFGERKRVKAAQGHKAHAMPFTTVRGGKRAA